MLYDENLKQVMLGILDDRVSGIACTINNLVDDGYLPNKKKLDILGWSTLLIHAYENIDIFSKEQQANLDSIYNKVIKM